MTDPRPFDFLRTPTMWPWAVFAAAFAMGCLPAEPAGPATGEVSEAAAAAPKGGSGYAWSGKRWTNGVVHYLIDIDGDRWLPEDCKLADDPELITMTDDQVAGIHQAIAEYTDLTPLRFVEHSTDLHFDPFFATHSYLIFRSHPSGSSANIRGQPVDGSPNCVFVKTLGPTPEGRRAMMHEIGHVLGMAHEQQRPDRDDYVVFNPDCLVPGLDPEGKLYGIDDAGLKLTPYDPKSIMQYGSGNSCACLSDGGICIDPPLYRLDPSCTPAFPLADDSNPSAACGWIPVPFDLSKHDVNAFTRMYERPLGTSHAGDAFGDASAVGDFDDDGYLDLAVGAPGKNRVYLWKGTAGSQEGFLGRLVAWKVLSPAGIVQLLPFSKGRFGAALAAGDFDNDGKTDLAVGAPGPDGGPFDDGTVFFFRSEKVAPSPRRTLQFWKVASQIYLTAAYGDPGDHFGAALAAGDFDKDGAIDLAIGVPRKVVGGTRSGEVIVMLAASPNAGVVLTPALAPGGVNLPGARFGAALAAGQFAPDLGRTDLVVGSPENASSSGAVYLFAGKSGGPVGRQVLRPKDEVRGQGMRFGAALAIGDFDNSLTAGGHRQGQLAVGAPDRAAGNGALPEAGGLYIFTLTPSTTALHLDQALRTFEPGAVAGNHLGGVLLGWHWGDGPDALFAGLPDAGGGAGKVEEYIWSTLDAAGQTFYVLPRPGNLAPGDRFGATLALGNFLPDMFGLPGEDELVVGAPGTHEGAGAFDVHKFGTTDEHVWHHFEQDTANPE